MSLLELEEKFNLTTDFKKRILNNKITLYYLETIVNVCEVETHIIDPIQEIIQERKSLITFERIETIISSLSYRESISIEEIVAGIIEGNTFISIEGKSNGLLVSTPNWLERSVEAVNGERSLKGPIIGFTEKINSNINIIRSIVKTHNLIVEKTPYGNSSSTDIAIMYMRDLVNNQALEKVKERIAKMRVNYVIEARIVEDALEGKPKTFADLVMTKERVDTTTSSLLEGRVIIFVDGAPYAIIAPTLFFDFFQAADDYHMKAGRFINRLIRILSFLISIFIPAVYVTVEKHMGKTFSETTQKILFNKGEIIPTFWEIAILLILFRILVDIGVRAPRGVIILIATIATIVIGQTSVTAKLIHPTGLVVVGLSVFLSFLIIYRGQTGLVFNLRYAFLIAGNYFGFSGITILATITLIYLAQLKSLGVPYLSPFFPFRPTEFRDVLIRGDLRELHNRKHIFPNESE